MDSLPIELVPNTNPPRFKWKRVVDTPTGRQSIDCNGCVQSSMEDALVALIAKTCGQIHEIAQLRAEISTLKKTTTVPATVAPVLVVDPGHTSRRGRPGKGN